MELTVEDPVFLTRPYTETFEYERTDQEVRRINDCDPGSRRRSARDASAQVS